MPTDDGGRRRLGLETPSRNCGPVPSLLAETGEMYMPCLLTAVVVTIPKYQMMGCFLCMLEQTTKGADSSWRQTRQWLIGDDREMHGGSNFRSASSAT